MTAAYILWALQRVFLGPLNPKYKGYPDANPREVFALAPLLFLCVFLGIFPSYLLDWMNTGVMELMKIIGPGS